VNRGLLLELLPAVHRHCFSPAIRGKVSPMFHVWVEATQTRSLVSTDGETGDCSFQVRWTERS